MVGDKLKVKGINEKMILVLVNDDKFSVSTVAKMPSAKLEEELFMKRSCNNLSKINP